MHYKAILFGSFLPLLLAGTAAGQWIVVEDFENDLPVWDSVRNDGGFPWGLSLDPDNPANQVLNHDLIDNVGLEGKNYVACKVYPVTPEAMLGVRIRNRGSTANGYGTMACVIRGGVHTAEEIFTDYSANGVFNDWTVVAHSREAPYTVGIWDNTWHESSVFFDTAASSSVTVGFVAVAALGSSPEAWYDDLEFLELAGPVTGVDPWEIYR
jgi:hypothetical protein